MPRTTMPRSRPPVTSDPDRGVAVNSGTDPQRPGEPARPIPDASAEKSGATAGPAEPPPRPSSRGGNDDVEGGGRNEPDDPF